MKLMTRIIGLTSQGNYEFVDKKFDRCDELQGRSFNKKFLSMHDNASSHAAKTTRQSLERTGNSEKMLVIWPPASPNHGLQDKCVVSTCVEFDLYCTMLKHFHT